MVTLFSDVVLEPILLISEHILGAKTIDFLDRGLRNHVFEGYTYKHQNYLKMLPNWSQKWCQNHENSVPTPCWTASKKTPKWSEKVKKVTPKQSRSKWLFPTFSTSGSPSPPKGSPPDAKTSPGPLWDRFFFIFWCFLSTLPQLNQLFSCKLVGRKWFPNDWRHDGGARSVIG